MVQEQVRNPAQQHLAYDWNGIGPGRELDERRPTAPKVETRPFLSNELPVLDQWCRNLLTSLVGNTEAEFQTLF